MPFPVPTFPRRVALVLLTLSASSVQAGEIYSWKDANGRTHYSDVKPELAPVKKIPTPPPASAGRSAAGESAATKPVENDDPETAFRKRREAAIAADAKADKERQQAALAKENCDAMTAQLTALRSGERMARYNSAGEKEVIDDGTRAAEITRLERNVAASCK
ncbi:MAG: DUF4124 domain-containing protein [Zoogloeaceae bacterium]|nr:DUF4124 domain-containing protein [Zoogloeaceae bacterium]